MSSASLVWDVDLDEFGAIRSIIEALMQQAKPAMKGSSNRQAPGSLLCLDLLLLAELRLTRP